MIQRGKPEPDIYIKACEIIKVEPIKCFALEDSSIGIISAYRAGLKPVLIPDLIYPDEKTSHILYAEVQSFSEVINLLENQNTVQ